MGVLVVCVLVFTVFCTDCNIFLYGFFIHIHILDIFLVLGQMPPIENSIAVSNNNNNNNNKFQHSLRSLS